MNPRELFEDAIYIYIFLPENGHIRPKGQFRPKGKSDRGHVVEESSIIETEEWEGRGARGRTHFCITSRT